MYKIRNNSLSESVASMFHTSKNTIEESLCNQLFWFSQVQVQLKTENSNADI